MRSIDIENKVLQILEMVQRHAPIEDDRIELKATWPADYMKVARQLAGHANAARGDNILWLIGVDEKTGVVGADFNELSNWLSSVCSHFDDALAPTLNSLNVPFSGKTVVALFFETDRAPYVVKLEGGGSTTREVTWREGNSTRSACRSDLIRLLVPIQRLPFLEFLSGNLSITQEHSPTDGSDLYNFWLRCDLYITPADSGLFVIPFHRCSAEVRIGDEHDFLRLNRFRLYVPSHIVSHPFHSVSDSLTLENTTNELIVSAPGMMHLSAESLKSPIRPTLEVDAVKVKVQMLSDPNSEFPISLSWTFRRNPNPDKNSLVEWTLKA